MQRVLTYLETPMSQLDVNDTAQFMETEKQHLKEVEADIKDGKRRVSSAKGPRPSRRAQPPDDDLDSDGSGDDDLAQ